MRLTVTPTHHFTVMIPEVLLARLIELQEKCVQIHGPLISNSSQGYHLN